MILNNALIGKSLKSIHIENGVIVSISDYNNQKGIDIKGKRVIPGLVDIHSHGAMGHDTMDADFKELCEFYGRNGTTSWLPTTLTMDYERLFKVCNAERKFPGANILGFHFEGPFINYEKKGGQNPEYIRNPSLEEFKKYSSVKMISMAPEIPGGIEFIKNVSGECVVSIGHTCCDYDTAVKAFKNGAKCLTHTFNAMPPLLHRAPGPIGAAIEQDGYAQIICDGHHIEKSVIIAAYRVFGPSRMVLISDTVRCAYLPEGRYQSDGLYVNVKGNTISLDDGTLAGSSATLWDCVKTAVKFGIPFDDAVRMATQTPAELLGVKKGRIEEGWDADLLIIDDEMNIETVIINGEVFFERYSI